MPLNQVALLIKIVIVVHILSLLMGCASELPQLPPYAPPARENVEVQDEAPFVEASPKSQIGGLMEYLHDPMREYPVYAQWGGLTPIALTPGSRVGGISIANPDGWRIDDRQSFGSGRSSTPLVVVSPGSGARRTTAVVTTAASDGMFMLDLIPHKTGFRQVKFRKAGKPSSSRAIASGPSVSAAGIPYRLRGDRVPWQPLSVRDDGRHTFVELRPGSDAYGVPAVMAIGPDDETRPVNARRQGNVLVVDGIHLNGLRLALGEQEIEARRN